MNPPSYPWPQSREQILELRAYEILPKVNQLELKILFNLRKVFTGYDDCWSWSDKYTVPEMATHLNIPLKDFRACLKYLKKLGLIVLRSYICEDGGYYGSGYEVTEQGKAVSALARNHGL